MKKYFVCRFRLVLWTNVIVIQRRNNPEVCYTKIIALDRHGYFVASR